MDNLAKKLTDLHGDKIFLLADSNTEKYCLPLFDLCDFQLISIPSGENNKNLNTLEYVWRALESGGATRQSLLLNLGGGVVCDVGGFAAATFKRGMRFLNIPTTLLAAVDAAHGGKTGVNFDGLKNEIGTFAHPAAVIVDTRFFRTLSSENLLSGFAEMFKHALIASQNDWQKIRTFDLELFDLTKIKPLIFRSIKIKQTIVEQDFKESGKRKILNLGHTFAHALEAVAQEKGDNILHGYAVMWGLVAELYLSVLKLGLECETLRAVQQTARQHYGNCPLACNDYEKIYAFICADKKNSDRQINCTLLAAVGEPKVNQKLTKEELFDALDFLCFG